MFITIWITYGVVLLMGHISSSGSELLVSFMSSKDSIRKMLAEFSRQSQILLLFCICYTISSLPSAIQSAGRGSSTSSVQAIGCWSMPSDKRYRRFTGLPIKHFTPTHWVRCGHHSYPNYSNPLSLSVLMSSLPQHSSWSTVSLRCSNIFSGRPKT